MSSNKLKVGRYIRIEYKGKWYRAKIIEMTKDNIAIKLWKSPFKTKLFDVPRNTNVWLNMVLQRKIYCDDNYFPKWFKISKNICLLQSQTNISYCKIGDICGHRLVLYSIDSDANTSKLNLITKTMNFDQIEKMLPSDKYENYVSTKSKDIIKLKRNCCYTG